MYKIKPSLIEDFRIMRAEVFDKDPLDLIAKIKGEYKSTRSMQIGSLVHSYLENGTTKIDDMELMNEEIASLQFISLKFLAYQHEIPFQSRLTDDILISGKVDLLSGRIGAEIKTGSRFWGVDFYDSSWQWKLYAVSLNLSAFKYFHITIGGTNRPHSFKLSEFTLYPYAGIKQDMINECRDFIGWCKACNLEKYITI